MPSASIKVEKSLSLDDSSLKPMYVALEKKIRNLEKRKGKLDSYKEDRQKGVTLNEDQKSAVAKYTEVVSLLEYSKEIQKLVIQVNQDIIKSSKKQARRDQAEKQSQDLSRTKDILLFQSILNSLNVPNVQEDFLAGSNGAIVVPEDMLTKLSTFNSLISLSPCDSTDSEKTFDDQLTSASEHLVNLLESRNKEACGTTYKEIHELLRRIKDCKYFDKSEDDKPESSPEEVMEEDKPKEEKLVEEEIETAVTPSQQQSPPTQAPAADTEVSHTPGQYNDNLQQQNARNTSVKFNFLQESEIDLESPHMDPAVVMAHPMAPAPPAGVAYPPGSNVDNVFHSAAGGEQVQQTRIQANESREEFNPTQPIPSQTFTNQNYNAPPPLSQSYGNMQHISNSTVLHPSHDNQTVGPPPPIPMPNQQSKSPEQSSFGTPSQLGFNNAESQSFDHSAENEKNLNGTAEDQLGQNSESTNTGFTSQHNRSSYGGNRGNHRRGNGNRGAGNYRPRGYQNGRGGYQGSNRDNYYHSNNYNGNREMGNYRGNKGTRGAGGMRGSRGRGGYNRAEQ